jgi:hypothetical protein
MRRCTSLDADETWWQFLKERQHVSALQLTTDHYLAGSINTVHLKH